jgi:DNA-binding NarL/FixJ family response regulator
VGEAENGFEVQKLVAELRPQVAILDLIMPGPRPAELERWIRENYPETTGLVLTAHDRDPYLSQMIDAGVAGYLSKNENNDRIIAAIRKVASGDKIITDEQIGRMQRWKVQAGEKWAKLTRRQHEVLQLMKDGLGNAQIAAKMGVKTKTIDFHIANILKIINVSSRTEAIAWMQKYIPEDF